MPRVPGSMRSGLLHPVLVWTVGVCGGVALIFPATPGRAEGEDVPAIASPTAAEPAAESETEPDALADVEDSSAEDSSAAVDASAEPSREDRNIRVRVRLDVTGELLAPAGPEAAPVREAVEMAARFDFEETPLVSATPEATAVVRRAYRDATASMRVGDVATTATLASDARRLLVTRQGTTPMPYLAEGFLSGEESDLLETPFDSLLIDDLLPGEPVSIGTVWEIPADITAGLLAIDTVESGVIEARVQEVADTRATVAFSGIIDGAVDGVPTHVTVEGSFAVAAKTIEATDDSADSTPARLRLDGRVAKVSAVIRERRQASHVAPGFEVEARLLVARTFQDTAVTSDSGLQADSAADVPDQAVREQAGEGQPLRRLGKGEPGRVWYRDPRGRFDLVHDVRWRRVEDGANGLVMRLVDRGALVGQCSLTSLPQATAASLPTRDDVQRDVERSLAGQVVRTDAAEESDRSDGVRVVRLASSGTAGRLPFHWIHYVLAAPDGSRVNVTFMFEESMQHRFGTADRHLIEGLRLLSARPDKNTDAPPGPTAVIPGGGRPQPR